MKNYRLLLPGVTFAIGPALSYISLPLITNSVNVSDYGTYTYYLSLLSVISFLSLLPALNATVNRYGSKSSNNYINDMYAIRLICYFSSIIYAICVFFICFNYDYANKIEFLVISMSIFSVNIFSVIKSYLLINNSKGKYSFFVITINLFQYSYLFYAFNSNDFTISDIIFGNVILFIFILLYKARSLIRFPPSPSAQLGLNHKIIKFMGMSFAISLSTIIYNNTDKIMIEHLLGESRSLALYQVSYQIFAFPIESMYALISIFTPAFLYRAFDKDVNLYEFNLKVTFKIVLFIIFLLSQLLFLNKIYLKDLLLDSNYIVEDSLPMIFLVSQSVFLLYLISTNIFIVYDKRSYIIGSLTLSSLINILLNWYLIPKFGYVGAAIATLASYSVLTAIVFIIAFNVFKFRFFDWKDCCLALSVPMTYGILGDNYIIYLISIVAISLFYFLTNIKNTYINFLRGV